jgi:Flp pilus assembly protein TadG
MTMLRYVLRAFIRDLLRDSTGAAMIELGLVAPVLIFIVLAMSDMAQGFSTQLQLKQAADRTIALATMAGQRTGSYSYLQAEGANASGQPTSNVAVSSWLECNGVKQSPSVNNCTGGAQFARYVSVAITGNYTPAYPSSMMASIYGGTLSMANTISMTAKAAVRVQ